MIQFFAKCSNVDSELLDDVSRRGGRHLCNVTGTRNDLISIKFEYIFGNKFRSQRAALSRLQHQQLSYTLNFAPAKL